MNVGFKTSFKFKAVRYLDKVNEHRVFFLKGTNEMLYRVLIILLLLFKCTTADAFEDYNFLNGEWTCKMKSVLENDAILEVDSHIATSIKNLNSYAKSFF